MARVMARLRPTSLTTRGGLGRAGQVGDRHGRAAGQGDADRQRDPPDAARGGHRSTTPAGHGCAGSTRPRSPSSRRAWPLELVEELERITLPFTDDAILADAELRIAQAELVGWLEGAVPRQTALFAQQMAARARLEQRRRALPPGPVG
jgi:hypothetical protein